MRESPVIDTSHEAQRIPLFLYLLWLPHMRDKIAVRDSAFVFLDKIFTIPDIKPFKCGRNDQAHLAENV